MKENFPINKNIGRSAAPDRPDTTEKESRGISETFLKKIEDLFSDLVSDSRLPAEIKERILNERLSEGERNSLGVSENEWRSWTLERKLRGLLNIVMTSVAEKAANMSEAEKRILKECATGLRENWDFNKWSNFKERMHFDTIGSKNSSERMRSIDVPFQWGVLHDNKLWIGEVERKLVAIPNMSSATSMDAACMGIEGVGEAFWYDENDWREWWEGGRSSSRVRILKPAIFEKNGDEWKVKEKGLIDFSQDGKYEKIREEQERKKGTPAASRKTEARPRIVEFQFQTDMKLGDRSEDVRKLQQLLAEDRDVYPEGRITGHFWMLTKKAVERFQEKYGIASPGNPGYGIVGPKTLAKLNEELGRKSKRG